MAFTVRLYTFSKKGNSTAQPSGGNSFSCTLKEPCSVLNPVIRLDYSGNPTEYNYAYIPEFGRYYYIRDWVYTLGLWDANLDADVLASWKSYIGSTSCYVVRAANASNGNIIDTLYPMQTTVNDGVILGDSPWSLNIGSGRYVVGVAGASTAFYSMSPDNFNSFMNYIFSESYLDDLMNDWADAYPEIKTQVNPVQYIKSVMWFPRSDLGGIPSPLIPVGWVLTLSLGSNVTGVNYISGSVPFSIPRHPSADSRGNFLNAYANASSYSVYFPPFGRIDLDPIDMANTDNILCEWKVDIRTGIGYLRITDQAAKVLATCESMVAVPIQVTDLQAIGGYGANSLIGDIGNVASSLATMAINPVMGAISTVENLATSVVSGVGESLLGNIPRAVTFGSNGGLSALEGSVKFQYTFKTPVGEDIANKGRPYCMMATPASLGGYMLCSNVGIEFPGTDAELSRVKYLMETGFYYE